MAEALQLADRHWLHSEPGAPADLRQLEWFQVQAIPMQAKLAQGWWMQAPRCLPGPASGWRAGLVAWMECRWLTVPRMPRKMPKPRPRQTQQLTLFESTS